MSEEKAPREFQLIEDAEAERLLQEGAKSFSATQVWTKDQKIVVRTHITHYGATDRKLFTWVPKGFDADAFLREIERAGNECTFSVSLTTANIFFKSAYRGRDAMGLLFDRPARVFKVQRRKDLRYRILEGHVIKVEFQDPNFPEKRITKKLFDLSASGLAFLADPHEDAFLLPGLLLRDMQFTIDGRKYSVDGEIRHRVKAPESKGDQVKVGVIFRNMRAADTQKIASYVFEESRKYFMRFL